MHAEEPRNGVRYELFLETGEAQRARYRAEVHTAAGPLRAVVDIDREGATLVSADESLDPAHRAQLVALARTLGKRDESPWPRRVNRWRSPGVR
jgi:hypothetical protein